MEGLWFFAIVGGAVILGLVLAYEASRRRRRRGIAEGTRLTVDEAPRTRPDRE